MPLTCRIAEDADLPAMREVMRLAIDELQAGFLSPEEIVASHAVMGLDTQLVRDGTYFVVEADGEIAGCGGWSRRATLYGGDHSLELREPPVARPGGRRGSRSGDVHAPRVHPPRSWAPHPR